LSAGKFRGTRPLKDVVEIAVRCLVHALHTGGNSSANADGADGGRLFDTVTLIGYSEVEQSLLAHVGQALSAELAAGGDGGGSDPHELFVHPFDVAEEATRMVELAGAAAASDAERVRLEAERRDLELRASMLAEAQSAVHVQEKTLAEAQSVLALEAGATTERRQAAEAQLKQVQQQELAARERMKREEETLKAAITAASAAAEAQHVKAAREQAAAEAHRVLAEQQQTAAEAAKAAAEKAKEEAEKAAARAKAEADRVISSSWASLNGGVTTIADVERFFAQRQPAKGSGGATLRIESAVCLANERALGSFKSTGRLEIDPTMAASGKGPWPAVDTLLFHGTSEAAVANIQATGRPTMTFAASGNLGRGIYGAPDPRKSLQYTTGNHGKFMFICRFNMSKAKHGNWGFDEYCVYDDHEVVVLWVLKLKQ